MSDDVRQVEPPDAELSEYWTRLPGEEENYLRGVEAARDDELGGWQVTVWAADHFREDEMGAELRDLVESALRAVPGVTSVQESGWVRWDVRGTPSGEALTRAAASVVDELAERMRIAYEEMS